MVFGSDLTIEQMETGLSRIRNRGIAEVFAHMHMIEGWGSGIPDMFMDAQQYGLPEPILEDRGSDFGYSVAAGLIRIYW
ncbi:MAG: hypothetical protein LUD07_06260 [Clostridiales bacterium]|nr:hypothetical protein [Clostridiales bacterium]